MKPKTQERPSIQIGKSGVTDALLTHIADTLRAQGSVKLKLLRSAIGDEVSTKQVATDLARKLGAKVSDVRGHTFVITK